MRDLVDLSPGVHRVLLQEAPRVGLGQTVLVHQTSLGTVDDLARFQPLGEVGILPLERDDLLEPAQRGDDRREEVAGLEGLDEVRERAGVAGLLDEVGRQNWGRRTLCLLSGRA